MTALKPFLAGLVLVTALLFEPPTEDDAARARSARNLERLAAAMMEYEAVHFTFPPAVVCDKDGKPLFSWRVLLLPYVDDEGLKLFKQFKLDEPWDGEHNKKLLPKMPAIYAPVRSAKTDGSETYYQVFTGNGAAFEGKRGVRIAEFFDGTSNTILLVEAGEPVPWTKPVDLPFDPENKPLPKLGGLFGGEFQFAFTDGTVHCGKKDVEATVLKAAITRGGGEAFDLQALVKEK